MLTDIAFSYVEKCPDAAGRTEVIVLQVVVMRDGSPAHLKVISTKPDPELAREVLQAGAAMRFRPARLRLRPVPVLITIPVTLRFPS